MAWDLNDQEFEAVLRLSGPERYSYFIKHATSHGELWGLVDGRGWVIAEDDAGASHFPVWPHPRFASACAQGPWSGATSESIDIDECVEGWLPKLHHDGLRVAVFQTPDEQGVGVGADRLREDLELELAELGPG